MHPHPENEGQMVEGDVNMLKLAFDYYTKLFGPAEEYEVQLDDEFWENLPKVCDSDNGYLVAPFTVKGWGFTTNVKNKAARPDKILIEFYQKCWSITRIDILKLFDDFFITEWISVD